MTKSLWTLPVNCEELNSRGNGNILSHLGIKFTEIGPDYLKASMPVDHRTIQVRNILHGGASVVLAETLGSMAAWLSSKNPQNMQALGVEINASHLRPVSGGVVEGMVKPVKVGRTLQVWDIVIADMSGNIVCKSRLTTMTVPQKKNA